jgi:hypothetical protein
MRIIKLVAYGENDGIDMDLLVNLLLVQIDRSRRADLLAAAAVVAIRSPVDDIGIWDRTRRNLVGCPARDEARFETARLFDRTDLCAAAAIGAARDIHVPREPAQVRRIVARLAANVQDLGAGQHLNIRVNVAIEKGRRDRGAGAAITVIGGAPAEDAVVSRKHKAELRDAPAQAVHRFDQLDPDTRLGEVDRRTHAGDAAPHHQDDGAITIGIAISNHMDPQWER